MKSLKNLLLPFICLAFSQAGAQQISHILIQTNNDTQCFKGNKFCFRDSITPIDKVPLKSASYMFDDGDFLNFNPLLGNVVTICKTFNDPNPASYGVLIEITDSLGHILKSRISNIFNVVDCSDIPKINSGKIYSIRYLSESNMVEINADDKAEPRVIDVLGRNIPIQYNLNNAGISIDLNQIPKGVYTLLLYDSTSGGTYALKLLNH